MWGDYRKNLRANKQTNFNRPGASFFRQIKTSRVGMNKFAIGKCLCFVDIKNVR